MGLKIRFNTPNEARECSALSRYYPELCEVFDVIANKEESQESIPGFSQKRERLLAVLSTLESLSKWFERSIGTQFPNGGSMLTPRAIALETNFIDVTEDFGAKRTLVKPAYATQPSEKFVSTDEIQNALDYLCEMKNGGTLYFPPGLYHVDKPLRVVPCGVGIEVKIRLSPAAIIRYFMNEVVDEEGELFDLSSGYGDDCHVVLEGGKIDQRWLKQDGEDHDWMVPIVGIRIGRDNVTVRDMLIDQFGSDGILLGEEIDANNVPKNIQISNCHINRNFGAGIRCWNVDGLLVERCKIYTNAENGIIASGKTIDISNNNFDQNSRPVVGSTYEPNSVFTNLTIEARKTILTSDVNISGNRFEDGGTLQGGRPTVAIEGWRNEATNEEVPLSIVNISGNHITAYGNINADDCGGLRIGFLGPVDQANIIGNYVVAGKILIGDGTNNYSLAPNTGRVDLRSDQWNEEPVLWIGQEIVKR